MFAGKYSPIHLMIQVDCALKSQSAGYVDGFYTMVFLNAFNVFWYIVLDEVDFWQQQGVFH
jgi:hypothetical protein